MEFDLGLALRARPPAPSFAVTSLMKLAPPNFTHVRIGSETRVECGMTGLGCDVEDQSC